LADEQKAEIAGTRGLPTATTKSWALVMGDEHEVQHCPSVGGLEPQMVVVANSFASKYNRPCPPNLTCKAPSRWCGSSL
jgi:hypothetical protein